MNRTIEKNGAASSNSFESSPAPELEAALALARSDRSQGLHALKQIFRLGTPPDPQLDGDYAGEFAVLDIAPGYTQLAGLVAAFWMPWRGKSFDAQREAGINIFARSSLPLARVMWPLYRFYREVGPQTYQAFPFRTRIGPGLADPDRQVLKIDYNLKLNPALNVRRVLDELVQVAPATYLGKAHLRWYWGRWQTVAFFTLAAS